MDKLQVIVILGLLVMIVVILLQDRTIRDKKEVVSQPVYYHYPSTYYRPYKWSYPPYRYGSW